MRMVDLILKKRNGEALSQKEIQFIISGYTKGNIPDYQIAAWAMAIFYQGMSSVEVANLTMAMVHSGETVDLSPIQGIKVDKHSTGGVGDKISLIVAPLVASIGIPVAKMSGRGLGHTGGTIDKLEAFTGFQVELSREKFIQNVNQHKLALVGQSGNLTPADKKLYALRDVTATVDSIPLIASSIMSKKLASGADAIVLDVKTGSGAFMKSLEGAKELAQTMVAIGRNLGKETVAVISDMNQPLGYEIGNANEVKEAIDVLQGKQIADVREISLTIAAHMSVLGGVHAHVEQAYLKLSEILDSAAAIPTLKRFIEAQGGDPKLVENPSLLPQAAFEIELRAEQGGYIVAIDAEAVGLAAMLLGAGRKTKEDEIDHAVGITLLKKVGDAVAVGEPLALLHSNQEQAEESKSILQQSITISSEPKAKLPMIYEVIT